MAEEKIIWAKKPKIATVILQEIIFLIIVSLLGYAIYHLIDLFRTTTLYIDNLLILCIVLCFILIISALIAIVFVFKVNNKKWVELKFKTRKIYPRKEEI